MIYDTDAATAFAKHRNGTLDSGIEKCRYLHEAAQVNRIDGAILDIGCGPGFFGVFLRDVVLTDTEVILLDHSERMIFLARRNANGRNNMRFTIANACQMPLATASVGMCFMVNVLHQIRDRLAAFQEVMRALTPNGLFVVVTPSRENLRSFPLFAANPELAENQETQLPDASSLVGLADEVALQLEDRRAIRSRTAITGDHFLKLIGGRFLSILRECSDTQIQSYVRNTKDYLSAQEETEVLPYWSDAFLFRKDGTR